MPRSNRSRIAFFARAGVSLALVAALMWRLPDDVTSVVSPSIPWLAVAMVLVAVAVGIRVVSFMLLVNREGRVIGVRDATYLTLVGAGAGLFLPGGAGDLFKAALGARTHGSAETIVASSVIDKLTSLVAVAAMGVVGSLLSGQTTFGILAAAVLAVAVLPLVAPNVVPWHLVVRLLSGTQAEPERLQSAVKTPPHVLLQVLVVSLAGWFATYTVVLVCCRAVGADVSAGYVYSLAPLITLVSIIPISLAGVGLSQVTMAWLLTRQGVPLELAASASFFQLIVNLVPGVLGIALYGIRSGGRHR